MRFLLACCLLLSACAPRDPIPQPTQSLPQAPPPIVVPTPIPMASSAATPTETPIIISPTSIPTKSPVPPASPVPTSGPTAPPSPEPSPSPTIAPTIQVAKHVTTAAYVYGYVGKNLDALPPDTFAPYVSWAITDLNGTAKLRAAGIKTIGYVDFWRNYASDNPLVGYNDLKPGGAHAGAEAKACNGTALTSSAYGGGYVSDPRSSQALGHAQAVVNYENRYGMTMDALFSDDTASVYGISLPCNYSESAWIDATNTVDGGLIIPLFVNSLNTGDTMSKTATAEPYNVLGAEYEGCYVNHSGPVTGQAWVDTENAEITLAAMGKAFWCYANDTAAATTSTQLRLYAYASFLLSYQSGDIYQTAFATSSLMVMPEVGLVVDKPQTGISSIADVQTGAGYVRSFNACGLWGKYLGPCIVAVNPSNVPQGLPSGYGHSLTFSGAGVLDGGAASVGQAPIALAPHSGAVLLP